MNIKKKENINVNIENYIVDNKKNKINKINKSITGYIDTSKREGPMVNSAEDDFIGNYRDIKKREDDVDNKKNKINKINKSITGYIDISKREGSIMNSAEVDFIKREKKIIEEEGQIGCIIC